MGALASDLAQLPSYLRTPEVDALIPNLTRPVEHGDELWHLWRAATCSSFYFACKTILNTVPSDEDVMTWRSHGPICLLCEDESLKDALIEYPRKMLKSSIVTVRRPIFLLMRRVLAGKDPDLRFFILSHKYEIAMRHWWDQKAIFDSDSPRAQFFRFLFGEELRPSDRWNDKLGALIRANERKDQTFEPVSSRGAGKHCDGVSITDLVDEENHDAPDQIEKAHLLAGFSLGWTDGPHAWRWFEQNRWGLNDVNCRLHETAEETNMAILSVSAEHGPNEGGEFGCINLPAYMDEPLEVLRELVNTHQTVWPERFTPKYLAKLRGALSPAVYSAQFLNQPEDPDAVEFNVSMLKRGKWIDLGAGNVGFKLSGDTDSIPLADCNVYIGWDPALDGKRSRSKNGLVVAAITPDDRFVVCYEYSKKEDPLRTLTKFVALARRFRGFLRASCVEEVAFQKVLRKLLFKLGRTQGTYLGLKPVKTPRGKTKDQRNRMWLGATIESGKFYILDSCPQSFRQFRTFGVQGAPNDLVDACAYITQIATRPFTQAELDDADEFTSRVEHDLGISGYGSALDMGGLSR